MLQEKEKKVERDRRKEGRVKGAGKLGGIKTEKEKIKAGEQSRGGIGKLLQETAK